MANTHKRKRVRRSLLTGRVTNIVRVKPQLPHTSGPFTRVRFFALRDEGVKSDGDLCLRDGRLVADPADSIALTHMLAEPLRDDRGSEPVWIDPVRQPEVFLETLVRAYGHGSYAWCEAVPTLDVVSKKKED